MMKFAMHALAIDKAAKKIMLSSNPKLPKGKRYTKVEKASENYKLVMRLIEPLELLGKVLSAKEIANLTRIAAEVLQCPSSLVRPLIQEFLGVFIDISTLDLLAWQIAGNRTPVKEKEINLFNNRQSEKGWMAGVILDIVRSSDNKNYYAKIKLLDGPGAGFLVYAKMPDTKLYRVSYILGNIKKGSDNKKRGMQDIRQCVLSRVLVYTNGEGNVYKVVHGVKYKRIIKSTNVQAIGWLRATAKQKKLNKELFITRLKPCVKKLKVACHFCRYGYDGVDSCFRACRSKTLAETKETSVIITFKGKNICQRSLEEV